MRELTEARAIEAILAYHAQFTVTPSERERMIIIAVLGWMDEGDIRDVYNNRTNSVYNMFTQSYAYKAIPPAVDRSVNLNKTMPSRESAEEWADNACCDERTDEGVWIGEYTLNAMMEMYDWLTSTENKEVWNVDKNSKRNWMDRSDTNFARNFRTKKLEE